jgi:hypothetical protein
MLQVAATEIEEEEEEEPIWAPSVVTNTRDNIQKMTGGWGERGMKNLQDEEQENG